MKNLKALLFVLGSVFAASAQQEQVLDTVQPTSQIEHQLEASRVNLTASNPSLQQIAGAPSAFYKHYWEFGDGQFSKEESPEHTYEKAGDYEVKLWVTNNYATGKPPVAKPVKIKVNTAAVDYTEEASMTDNFSLQRNREPVPEEDIVVILSYKNDKDYATSGILHLFYNEQKYKADNFELIDTRMYHNESPINASSYVFTEDAEDGFSHYASIDQDELSLKKRLQDSTDKTNLPLTLAEAQLQYKASSALAFADMKPSEERHIFYSFKTTPEMLKDTSAIISIRGVYIPDNAYDNHTVKDMEMEIVTSHDPNKMSTNSTFLNYRLVRFKRPKFKIRFQNNGEGPANTIRLETDLPELFDKSTLKVEDMYPKCEICPKGTVQYSCLDTTFTETQAIFTFKNIYLPGSEQKNVKDYDSTQGFVKYSLKFGDDFHKKKTKSRTAIIFDKNEPIITNYSTTRFLPGISIGAKAGYNAFSDLENSDSYFVGATVSPYKSYKWYWQVELLNSLHTYDGKAVITESLVDDPAAGLLFYQRTTSKSTYDNIDWEIPILLRYNINNYLGLGAGIQASISLSEKRNEALLIERFEGQDTSGPLLERLDSFNETRNSFVNYKTGFLIEATAGFARIGPSLGLRYIFNTKADFNYTQVYAIWKF